MKNRSLYVFLMITLLFASINCFAQDRNVLWDDANTYYVNGNYSEAIVIYDSILQQGYVSSKLYYNLGNAYFKAGNLGKAILNYNKALKLAPSDADIKHNLSIAESFRRDKIEEVPDFFLKNFIRESRMAFSSNTWAILSLVFFAAALIFLGIYLLSGNLSFRKTGFYGTITSIAFFTVTLCFSISGKLDYTHNPQAIVMNSSVSIKSSPERASKDIFILHEGTKVRVVAEFDGWMEIMIADGKKGWLPAATIEIID